MTIRQDARGLPLGLLLALGLSGHAFAQDQEPAQRGDSRIEVGLAFAQSLGSQTFGASQTQREYAEDATFDSSYKTGSAPGGAFHLQYNLTDRFGLRVGAQTFSRMSEGSFNGRIPHPFFFSQPRSISGTQSDLAFTETAFSLTGVVQGRSGNWSVSLEGGPAYFKVDATVAERIGFTDVYPFDTATFSGITSSKHSVSPFGFAVGLEIGREFSPSVAAVLQGRFTQASGDISVKGQTIGIKAGGAQVRLGLRFVLARKGTGR